MRLFDRFRKRVKEVADDVVDGDLFSEVDSVEAREATETGQALRAERAERAAQSEATATEGPLEIPPAPSEPSSSPASDDDDDDWDDDWDGPPAPAPDLSRRGRRKAAPATPAPTAVRPVGSRVDLRVDRSTTGRRLVSITSAPRGSAGATAVTTESGRELLIDLGGGVIESGGRVIKDGPAFDSLLEELEFVLLEADMGRRAITEVLMALRTELVGRHLRKGATLDRVLEAALKRVLRQLLATDYWNVDATVDAMLEDGDRPVVILLVGVNGTGKTTTAARLGWRFKQQGKRVVFAAADTFRAGAIEQLETHAERLGIRVISSQRGGDPAAIARDAIEHGRARHMDVVIVDTAGRMQNKQNLMEELRKVHRVCQPHLVLFVGDALAGNDAVEQAVMFQRMLAFDGAVLCKLDTDAKGGAALSVAHATGRPIVFAGMGQGYPDLHPFDPEWLLGTMFE